MDFSNKLYVYVDAAALQDPQAEHFMEVLAKQYRQIILFVENVWEEETLKQLPAYGYICRTVYGRICKAFWKRTVRGVLRIRLSIFFL